MQGTTESLPGQALDVLTWPGRAAIRYFGGTATAPTEFGSKAADVLGLPTPQTPGEITRSGIVRGGTAALVSGVPAGAAIKATEPVLAAAARPYAAKIGDFLAASPVAGTAAGAASGGASGGLAAMGADPWAQALGGVATGALAGLVPGATAGFANAADRALVNTAREKFGIRIAPAQTDPLGKYAFSATKELPFSGGTKFVEAQHNEFNAAAGKLFGAEVDANGKLLPKAINEAEDALGDRFSTQAKQATAAPTDTLNTTLDELRDRAAALGTDAQPIVARIDNLRRQIAQNRGILPGNVTAAEISSKSPASIGARAGGTIAQPLWNDYREALRDFVGSNPNIDRADWADARRMYRNMKNVQPTININGDVSPALLANAAKRNASIRGFDPDLHALGQIGQRYLKEPPQSGTAPRGQVYETLKDVGKSLAAGIGITGAEHVSPGTAMGLAGLLGGGATAQRLMHIGARSPTPNIGYPGFVARNAAIVPTQPPVGTERMNPYWRALMGQ
jgi:hypothetical protein